MRYGVVGASGTLGQVVVRQLLARSTSGSVNVLLRKPDRSLAALDRCEIFVGGIFDDDQLENFVKASDVVINFAARNPAGNAEDRQNCRDFFEVNGIGAATVAAVTARNERPLVHFSSVAVYETDAGNDRCVGTERDVLPAPESEVSPLFAQLYAGLLPLFEQREKRPDHRCARDILGRLLNAHNLPPSSPVYGLSKLLGEALALRTAQRICAVRMSDVYGPGHESRGVVTDHLRALAVGRPFTLDFGFRSSIYFVYIDDVSELIADIANRCLDPGDLPSVVNFVGERTDEAKFADVLRGICGDVDIAVRDSDERPAGIDRRYARELFERSFRDFNFTPFADGIRTTLAG